jgi:parvulin-like peptidyl-prolyl isomerase
MQIEVNGEQVPNTAIEQQKQRIQYEEKISDPKKLDKAAEKHIVTQTLLRQEAVKKQYEIPQIEVDEEFRRLKEEYGGDKYFYKRFNITPKEDPKIKEDVRNRLMVERFIKEITADLPTVSEEEIATYYNEHTADYVQPEQVKAAHIVKPANGKNPIEVYEELADIRKQLMDGADFAKLADKHSDCHDRGGDLGYFARGQMVEEFECVVFSMNPGEVSPVFKTQFGFHVAVVEERRPERQRTLEESKKEIRNRLKHERDTEKINDWAAGVRKTADIRITND